MQQIRVILHPTDFSASAECAFRLACTLARGFRARLIVLHVAREPVISPVSGPVPAGPEHYHEELTDRLLRLEYKTPELDIESQLVFAPNPGAQIVQRARDMKTDLIVMGTHGRTGLGRLLTGSVADYVLRHAPCPVATVKDPLGEGEPYAALFQSAESL
jgi:nucleotide-binding universal stress UspA family protein